MSAYLDASVILPILVEEAASALVDDFIANAETTLIVSEFAAAGGGVSAVAFSPHK